HMQYLKDRTKYQGQNYQFAGFDELTHFLEDQYTYITASRVRKTANSIIPNRVFATANTGGIGHEWVKQRCITEGRAKGRMVIPSKLEDNPHLNIEDYEKQLAELPPLEREQLRHGNWDVEPQGTMFEKSWFNLVDRIPYD